MPTNPPSATAGIDARNAERPSLAVIIIAAGAMSFSALHMIRLSLRHDPRVHVPTPIVFVLAFVMLTGSAMAVLKVLGRGEHMDWLAVPLLLGMTVTFGWIGLYGDARHCSSSGPLWMPLPSCHVAFTAVAALMLLVTWIAARSWWRRWRFSATQEPPRVE